MKVTKWVPWLVAAVAVVGALGGLMGSGHVRGFDVQGFASLPVLEGGRVKPLDSLARNSLLVIRSQQSFRYNDRTVGADEWLLNALFRPEIADNQPIFVINDPDVLSLIGLRQTSDRYFSFKAMQPYLPEIEKQAAAAHAIDAKQRSRFQSAVANLFERLFLYHKLQNTLQLRDGKPLTAELADRAKPESLARQQRLAELGHFRILPGRAAGSWRNVGEALHDLATSAPGPGLVALAHLGEAYASQEPEKFNAAVAQWRALVAGQRPEDATQARSELTFNHAQPFYTGMVIYVLALLTLFASWLGRREVLQASAFALLLVGSGVHTAGLVSRVILQGRPPVTNLYSSAVFVGWAAVILGVVLERLYRKGFGTAVAAASGFASLIVAHHLAADGDTMEMMRAVLDSNFWLATHVVTITIGYSGTFLAGAIAIGYTLRRHIVKQADPATSKALVGMAYGIVCFSLLFSFVGTVLGGIWADQSWGRFWGWDPKENGALLIVLWNAIILHARWGGYVREKGIMAMALFGSIITSLSWFGVNMLGVGLHSYGFMDKAFWSLSGFCGSHILLMAICLAPPRFWRPVPKVVKRTSGPLVEVRG